MRFIKLLGLVASAAVIAVAISAAPAAMAGPTALCATSENPCSSGQLTDMHATLAPETVWRILTNIVDVLCLDALVNALADQPGAPQQFEVSLLEFSTCGTKSTHDNCEFTLEEAPQFNLLRTGSNLGELTAVNGLLNIYCENVVLGIDIDCKYSLEGFLLHAKGAGEGNNGQMTMEEALLEPVGDVFLCPDEAFVDGTLEFSTPTYIASDTAPVTEEEQWGECNPASIEMPRCLTGDPINAATGNLTESQTDIGPLGGRGPPLAVTRSYNAQLAATQKEAGDFGYGWTGPYSAHLAIGSETATVHHDNGSASTFYLVEGKYRPGSWSEATLVKEGESYTYTLPDQSKLEFNKSGQLTKVADRYKNALTLTYKEGKLETVKDAASRTLTFTYKEGRVESVKDPMGNSVKYTYESGNLATVTLPGEEKANWKFKYDGSHRLTERTDGRGSTTKNEFDGSNRVTLQTDPLENKRKLEYKVTEGVSETTITEPNGSKTLHKFNSAGLPTETVKAHGTELAQATKYEYNGDYELVKLTDANNHSTTYGYDAEGNKTSEKDANGNETKRTYNSTHDVLTETTPRGNTTTITRNAAGDPETIQRPAPGKTTQETKLKWAANGDLEEESDPLGRKTKFEYDTYGNVKAETNAAGDKTTWAYDEDGRKVAEISPRGNEEGAKASEFETKIERDAQGRPKTITDSLGHETKRKYDAAGNLEVLTNPNSRATTYIYDAANQRIEVKAANGDTTKTAYDSMGKIKSKTDGNGNTTKYERNALEQIAEEIDPLERKTTRKYDAAGNLKETKDPEGRTITYTYDIGNRLEKINYSEEATPDVTFKYDKDGNVVEMIDGTGTTKKTYDELNRLSEVENGNKEVVKYEYDLASQKTKITYPNGKSISRGFDNAGRLEKVTDWLGKETVFSYNRDSMLKTTTFPAASENKDEYDYNQADELIKTTIKRGSETLASISYARDSAGQVKSVTQTGLPGAEKPEYEFDERERLKKGGGTSFGYDAANNLTTLGSTTLKYDKASQLEEAGTTKYVFDKLGQRTESKPASGPVTKYAYDQAGNLISATRSEEGEVKKIEDTYAYDGVGLRASQKVSGSKAQMTWDVSEELPLLLYDGANYYIYGPDGLPFEQIASETATYLHHDHLGSTRMLTNASGEAKGKYTYTPYGAVEEKTGTATTPLGFAGQYRNESTGLIYLRARIYDPLTGQFMTADPLVRMTEEPYSYAGDNPVNRTDPSGLYSVFLPVIIYPVNVVNIAGYPPIALFPTMYITPGGVSIVVTPTVTIGTVTIHSVIQIRPPSFYPFYIHWINPWFFYWFSPGAFNTAPGYFQPIRPGINVVPC